MSIKNLTPELYWILSETGKLEERYGISLLIPQEKELDESSFNYGIIDKTHKNQKSVAYRIYIRDKETSAYEGKLSAHWFSIKVYKDGSNSKSGIPVRIKMTAYYPNGKSNPDKDDKDFENDLKIIQEETKLRRFVRNFIFNNQHLLIRYYLSNDEKEQKCIQEELQYKIDHVSYYSHNYDYMTQDRLDYYLSEEGKKKYVCMHKKNRDS